MTAPIVQSRDGITLLGAGAVGPEDLELALAHAPVLVAADGGAAAALAAGHLPEAVIGDLDSLPEAARAALGPGRLHRVPEQETTDFNKCLRLTAAPFHLAVGFLGRRFDHTLAAMTELVRAPGPVLALGEEDVIFRAPPRLALDLPAGTRLSLYPMGPVSGASEGLRWPVDRIGFAPAGRIGTSNEVTGPVRLALVGPMLVIVPRAQLGAAVRALTAAG
ncbi:thiamine pyrophosphokinase [Frigidibacter sp. MR17.24]|uniref:thiamine pyrophosphokinase n=1 Tax=Frigidibacter sp. MR17.24 TaxID=3127345 RepID=UPI003012AD6E